MWHGAGNESTSIYASRLPRWTLALALALPMLPIVAETTLAAPSPTSEFHEPVPTRERFEPAVAISAPQQDHTYSKRFDGFGRLRSETTTNETVTTVASVDYRYNRNGSLIAKSIVAPGVAGDGEHLFGYDQAKRLRRWTNPDGDITTYAFDDAGNRTRVGDVRFRFDQRNRLRSTTTGEQFTYDARGDMIRSTADGQVSNSAFDALGRLVADAGQTYSYDALSRLVRVGTDDVRYSGLGTEPVAIGSDVFGRLPGGELATSVNGDGSSTWWFSDRHRDTNVGVTSGGNPLALRVLDPFGSPIGSTADESPFGFQGDFTDPDTGRVWMGARWYEPSTARFVSRDTYPGRPTVPFTLNRYSYTSGDPLGMWDPTGRSETPTDSAAIVDNEISAKRRLTVAGIRSAAEAGIQTGPSGWAMHNAPTTGLTTLRPAKSYTQQFVTTFFTVTAGAACAFGSGGRAALSGAAGNACSGVFNRAIDSMFEGESALDSWTGAIFTPKTVAEVATGAAGGKATMALSGVNPTVARAAFAGGAVFAAEGATSRFTYALLDGASTTDAFQEATNGSSLLTDALLGSAIGTIGGRNNHSTDTRPTSATQAPSDVRAPNTTPSGPVRFRPPPGATVDEIAQVRSYVDGCNAALCSGQLSPSGRVSTKGQLRADASRAAAAERSRAAASGSPYSGHAGHVPDTTWTGSATPPAWMELTPRVNTSLGGQAVHYPTGYQPTIFEFVDGP